MPEDKKTEAVAEETGKIAAEDTAECEIPEEITEEAAAETEEPEEAGEAKTEEPETEDAEAPEDESAGEPEEGSEEGDEGKGRRFWQKQAKPQKKDKKDQLIEELNDRLARQLAEFENFRKRTDKEKIQNYTIGARDVLEKILPVLDNFERGLENADLSDPFADGMDKVYKQLSTTLESLGVTPIEAVGKEFDPNFHNAVMHVDDENLGENVVAEEFQKGYMYKDQVLRYSMVKVAN